MFKNHPTSFEETGQTLIETMVAVFIMVMGITAALGLANYSLNASSGIRNQIIGMGLAREGVEAFKNMRDTNWLVDTLSSDCYNYATGSQGNAQGNNQEDGQGNNQGNAATPSYCYRNWLNPSAGYNIQPRDLSIPTFTVDFDATRGQFWAPVDHSVSAGSYQLNYDPNAGVNGFYSHNLSYAPSSFYRQVVMDTSTNTGVFSQDIGPRVLLTSRVWWTDGKCPKTQTWPGKGHCSIELQMYLTNWKTF